MAAHPPTHADTTVGVRKVMSPDVDGFSAADAGTLRLMADLTAAAMFHAARNEANELYLRATHDALTGGSASRSNSTGIRCGSGPAAASRCRPTTAPT
ncbi:hypothetical protein SB786_29765 [Burkholderia sp. SIMBA_062]